MKRAIHASVLHKELPKEQWVPKEEVSYSRQITGCICLLAAGYTLPPTADPKRRSRGQGACLLGQPRRPEKIDYTLLEEFKTLAV